MLCGNELSSSLEDPPKENIAPFFFGRVGCKLLFIELGCSLSESSPEEPPSANIAGFFGAGTFDGMVVLFNSAERSGIDLCEELTCDGEKPLTTLVELCSEPPLTAPELCCEDLSDTLSEEPALTAEETSGEGMLAMSCGVVLRSI